MNGQSICCFWGTEYPEEQYSLQQEERISGNWQLSLSPAPYLQKGCMELKHCLLFTSQN